MFERTLLSAVLASVAASGAMAQSGTWTFSPEVFYGSRSGGVNPPINVEDGGPPAPGEILYSFGDLDNKEAWGGGLTVGYRLSGTQLVSVRGFAWGGFGGEGRLLTVPATGGIGNTSTTFAAVPGSNVLTNNTTGGFTAFDYDHSSRLWGLELNFQQ